MLSNDVTPVVETRRWTEHKQRPLLCFDNYSGPAPIFKADFDRHVRNRTSIAYVILALTIRFVASPS